LQENNKKPETFQEPFKKKTKKNPHGLKQGSNRPGANNTSRVFDGKFNEKGLYLKYKTSICKHYELN